MIPDRWACSTLSDCCGSPILFQGEMMAATERLHPLLKVSRPNKTNWRGNPKYFNSGGQKRFGFVNISPAWFQLGHSVSVLVCKIYYLSAAHFKWDRERSPAGQSNIAIISCLTMARWNLNIKHNFKCYSGSHSSRTLQCRPGEPYPPEGKCWVSAPRCWSCPQPMDIFIQRAFCYI